MANPLKQIVVTSPYGWRIHPITKKNSHHKGVDLRAYYVPVYSYLPGVILKVIDIGAYGKQIFIAHEDGSISHSAHLSKILVAKGQQVEEGQQIAVSGNTGSLTTAPHLHFGIKINGEWMNPMDILINGVTKKAIEAKYTIEGAEFKGLLIDGELWVKGRESHVACGNLVNWSKEGTDIVPVPKQKLETIKKII